MYKPDRSKYRCINMDVVWGWWSIRIFVMLLKQVMLDAFIVHIIMSNHIWTLLESTFFELEYLFNRVSFLNERLNSVGRITFINLWIANIPKCNKRDIQLILEDYLCAIRIFLLNMCKQDKTWNLFRVIELISSWFTRVPQQGLQNALWTLKSR